MDTGRTNFFSVNVDKLDDADFEPDCAGFLTRTIPAEQRLSLEQTTDRLESIMRKGSLPFSLEIIRSLCLSAFLLILAGLSGREGPLSNACKESPKLSFAAAAFFAAWLSLKIFEKIRHSRIEKQYSEEDIKNTVHSVDTESLKLLGVPEDAPEIEILSEGYTLRKGKRRRRHLALCQYANFPMHIFVEDGRLCIANLTERWDIPLSSLGRAVLVNKRAPLPNWFKEEPYTDEKYKQYKITTNNFGHYFSRFYRTDIDDERGDHYLLIPEYDGGKFFELTGLSPEEQ